MGIIKMAWEQVLGTAKKVFPYVLVGVGIGAIPIAQALLAKGAKLGVVLSFTMSLI